MEVYITCAMNGILLSLWCDFLLYRNTWNDISYIAHIRLLWNPGNDQDYSEIFFSWALEREKTLSAIFWKNKVIVNTTMRFKQEESYCIILYVSFVFFFSFFRYRGITIEVFTLQFWNRIILFFNMSKKIISTIALNSKLILEI